jgi:hypothetical protein
MQSSSFGFSKVKTLASVLVLGLSVFYGSALTISPARMELTADPTIPVSGKFLIVNEQNSDQTFYTSVENFEAQGESGTPSFSNSRDGFASWVNVIDKIEIKRGERLEIPFTVTVPKGADPGGHFAAIFLSTAPPAKRGEEVTIGAKVGMLMLLRVSGNIKESGGILSFSLKEGNKVYNSLPATFVYRFGNNGNDRVNPTGSVSIKNTIGMTTQELDANSAKGNILPNSVRRFEVKWGNSTPLPSTASFIDNVKYQYKNFALGMYTADLNLQFGSSGQASNSFTFYVLPWQLITVVALGLLLLWVLVHLVIKHHDKMIIQQLRKMQRREK